MDYELTIKEVNIPSHLYIEDEIAKRKNGLMTLILRIDKGKISDVSVVEYVDINAYLRPTSVVIEEFSLTSFTHNDNK